MNMPLYLTLTLPSRALFLPQTEMQELDEYSATYSQVDKMNCFWDSNRCI